MMTWAHLVTADYLAATDGGSVPDLSSVASIAQFGVLGFFAYLLLSDRIVTRKAADRELKAAIEREISARAEVLELQTFIRAEMLQALERTAVVIAQASRRRTT